MQNFFQYSLKGIQPDNLLAYLAVLGLLRSLEFSKPEWQPKICWIGTPLTTTLFITENVNNSVIVNFCDDGVKHLGANYDIIGDKKNIDYEKDDFRRLALNTRMNRETAQVVSTLASDGVTKKVKNEVRVKPTPLCVMLGSGRQNFLERLRKVPRAGNSDDIQSTLFSPWEYTDEKQSFRWDPIEYRTYAHQFGDPSESRNKICTVHGANRLAAIGFGIFCSAPKSKNISTPGFTAYDYNTSICWPLTSVPSSLIGLLALMNHPSIVNKNLWPELALYGVTAIAKARRFQTGKYFNFSRAQIHYLS